DGVTGFQAVTTGLPSALGVASAPAAAEPPQVRSALAQAPAAAAAPQFMLSQRLLDETGVTFATGQSGSDGTGVDWWLETMDL
ncbi:MAG TPA: hypothetical protein VEA40_13630, partial [Ramlibacter sp.]|nr:hypothetical protein [Ramlibacter sp.]